MKKEFDYPKGYVDEENTYHLEQEQKRADKKIIKEKEKKASYKNAKTQRDLVLEKENSKE